MVHVWVRDVLQISTNNAAAKCRCGNFHPNKQDHMDTAISIPKEDIKEITVSKTDHAVKQDEKAVA